MSPMNKTPTMTLDAHHRFAIAFPVAVLAFLAAPGRLGLLARALCAWDGFAAVLLLLIWPVLASQDPYHVRRNARLQDSGRTFLFIVVLVAAVASLAAAGLLMGGAKSDSASSVARHLALVALTVGTSWVLVHTLFALRYAHSYFRGAAELDRDKVAGGLTFPGEGSPDYLDFAYFSFVIGMTCQVSDVQITGRPIRRVALVHGLIAFLFNTAILAVVINIVVGLL